MSPAPPELRHHWFPLCSLHDLPARHIFETELLGQELAVWRGSDGTVNVWANRCPHRGMRFTVGANLGAQLRCAYHGYRFDNGSGQCSTVPAHPDKSPPRSLCATVFPALERHGLIWSNLAAADAGPEPLSWKQPLSGARVTALYALAIHVSAAKLAPLLAQYHYRPCAALREAQSATEACSTRQLDAFTFEAVATTAQLRSTVLLFMQPLDAHCTVIHGRLIGENDEALIALALQHHAERLTALRSNAELAAC
jgi:nitrite reductase/ring-hydroxylating ferredoxin subunit